MLILNLFVTLSKLNGSSKVMWRLQLFLGYSFVLSFLIKLIVIMSFVEGVGCLVRWIFPFTNGPINGTMLTTFLHYF